MGNVPAQFVTTAVNLTVGTHQSQVARVSIFIALKFRREFQRFTRDEPQNPTILATPRTILEAQSSSVANTKCTQNKLLGLPPGWLVVVLAPEAAQN